MENTLVCVSQTEATGKISYYLTYDVGYGVKIEQERGFLTVAEVEYLAEDASEVVRFIKRIAKGSATAITLYSLCDDFLGQKLG